mmetsp:Transcript_18761/g.23007  ORF Transcript_18761/g.23007 Transcript_18761/m.23007 type:complete len:196 (-) Transcript_18761:50-637(-)
MTSLKSLLLFFVTTTSFASTHHISSHSRQRLPIAFLTCHTCQKQVNTDFNVLTQIATQKDDNNEDENFKPNKPISLPSLENPPDAGPLYNTCKSITGIESKNKETEKWREEAINASTESFEPNKPIEVDASYDRSFLGLQPRSDTGEGDEEPLLMDTGLGVFTSSIILGGSIYFILTLLLDDGSGVEPSMIPLAF